MTSGGPLQAGSTFEDRSISHRAAVASVRSLRYTVEVYEPGKRYVVSQGIGGERIRSDWLVTPLSDQESELRLTLEYRARIPWSWLMADSRLRWDQFVRELLSALKKQVEKQSG
jgi:hypothetical protein